MAITAIELASFVPKSQEASQIKAVETQKPANEQLAFAEKFNDDIQRNSEQTVPTVKSDNPEYRYDAKAKSNNPYLFQRNKKKKKEKKDGTTSNIELPEEHHAFDVKI